MAFPIFDKRRGTWSVRWNNGAGIESETITTKPPKGWRKGDPEPRKPMVVIEGVAVKAKLEKERRRSISQDGLGGTVREFLQARNDFCAKRGSSRSAESFDMVFGRFADWCQANGVRHASDVTTEHCHRWMLAYSQEIPDQTGRPRAYASMKRDRALLAAAWNQKVRLGGLDRNPWVAVEVPGKPTAEKRGSWSPDEFEKILAVSRSYLQDFLILGCHTGLRIAALLGLEWRDVRFHREGQAGHGIVTVRKELDKGGKGYSVPMSRRCRETLERMKTARDTSTPFVVRGLKGKPITDRSTTATAIGLACKRAGFPAPSSPNHQMRRSFGRWAVFGQLTGRPVPVYIVSQWMGHSSVKMTEIYLDLKADVSHEWMEEDQDFHAATGHFPDDTNSSQ